MEVREEMETAIAARDATTLDRLRQWAADQRAAYLDQIGAAFAADDLPAVRLRLNALRYIERMIEQMPDDTA